MAFQKIKKCIHGKEEKGFLLIEVLLAVVILSVSLTLIIQSLMASLRAGVTSGDYSRALLLADSKMAKLMMVRVVERSFHEAENFPEPFKDYKYEVKTQDISKESPAGFQQVSLDVSWPSGPKERKLSLTTFLLLPKEGGDL